MPFSALGAVQLLWVNLIMDTFAALALATDPPTEALLNRRPERKSDDLINRDMWCQIIGQAIYQIIISFIMYGMADQIFGVDGSLYIDSETGVKIYNTTMVFNVFVLCQLFNEVNCRSITRGRMGMESSQSITHTNPYLIDINIFRGVHKNNTFMFIFALSMLLQVIIVQFGGPVFKTIPLQWREWLVCIAFGFGSIPVGFLIRIIPPIYPRGEKDPELKQKMEEQEAIMDAYELERVVIESVERTGGRPLNLEDRKLLQGAIKKTALQLRVLGDFKSASREVFTEGVRIGAQMAILSSQNNSQVASGHENSNDSITGIIPLSIHSVSDVRAGSGSVGSRVVSIDPFVCDGEKGSGAGLSLRVPPVSITKGHRAPEVLMNAAAIHDTTTAAEQAATSALIPEGGGEHSRSPSPNRPADELWKSLAMRVRREVSVVSAFRRYRRDVTMLSHPSSPISPMLANRRSTSIPQSPSPIKL